jgi:hypothetical protein
MSQNVINSKRTIPLEESTFSGQNQLHGASAKAGYMFLISSLHI